MSSTSTYELFKTKVLRINSHKNGRQSGLAVWNYISMKLYGKRFSILSSEDFWGCYKDNRLSKNELAVLLATYDRSYVSIDNLLDFAKACREVHNNLVETTEWDWSHLPAIAKDAEDLYKSHDWRAKGMCIGCTSVSDLWEGDVAETDTWEVYEEIRGIYNDEH